MSIHNDIREAVLSSIERRIDCSKGNVCSIVHNDIYQIAEEIADDVGDMIAAWGEADREPYDRYIAELK